MTWPPLQLPVFLALSALWLGLVLVSLIVHVRTFLKIGPHVPVPTQYGFGAEDRPRPTRRTALAMCVVAHILFGAAGVWAMMSELGWGVVAVWAVAILFNAWLYPRWLLKVMRSEGRRIRD